MTFDEILQIVILILASFGGGAVIVVSLSSWLGNLWASRILQGERSKFEVQLEALRHELGITKSAYEHHLDLILDYYSTFYRHYRMCQRTAHADAHRELPDGEIKFTKDEFIADLGSFLTDWAAQEGRIRLLLPAKLLAIHEEAVGKFNEFRDAVFAFTSAEPIPRKKEKVFQSIEEVKNKLESGLREFLRTESLLK
jgi:hypothetical protein